MAAFLVAAVVGGVVLALSPVVGLGLVTGAALVWLSARLPERTTLAYVVLAPLVTGLPRGAVVPLLRLNEALLLAIALGAGITVLLRWRRSGWRRPAGFHPLDLAVLAAACTSSVTPLLWMYATSRAIALDDVLYAVALWKLAVVYLLARLMLRRRDWVEPALGAVTAVAAVVGVVGLLQALSVDPVVQLLETFIATEEDGYDPDSNRASSTLGNPIIYGDLMVMATVATAAFALRVHRRRRIRLALTPLFVMAALASGQASAVLGTAVAGLALGILTGTLRRVLAAGAALAAVAALALRPVLQARLASLDPDTGLPISWTGDYGRLANLQTYFWPEIVSGANWLFGVRTSSRVQGDESWQTWVYIESGYVWALWNGGLPLLLSVVALLVLTLRTGLRLRRRDDPVDSALGVTAACLAVVLAVLTVLDPHLTLRGSGDVLFVLLALAATREADTSATVQPVQPVRARSLGAEAS